MAGRYKAYPEYKDSEVGWLGAIPSLWRVTALKRLCCLRTGLTPPTSNQSHYSDEETDFPWFRPEDLTEELKDSRASKYLTEAGWSMMRPVPSDSVLICCIGTIGKAGYVSCEAVTNQQITAATFRENSRYYFYVVLAARSELNESATGNVLKILNSERLGGVYFPIPPLPEQKQIARFLDHETGKIDVRDWEPAEKGEE
ncbi:MAG TPA: hypothetical protein DEA90_04790 [Opitutae bacterium]|nr:hypothetical protein [Puniceicoccaceae bacterium]HBR93462.1 hypothetical protein [Opitutae bacterium]|tara:strand:+ start:158 stop:757 length:600 start_codon:yes stop_codon:yes gene_type:complete